MKYSQFKAMWAITIASLRAIRRSPSAIVFSFVFPFIFIVVFGFIGNSGRMEVYNLALEKGSDTANYLYRSLSESGSIRFKKFESEEVMNRALQKGQLAGVVGIKNADGNKAVSIRLRSATSSNNQWPQVRSIIQSKIAELNNSLYTDLPTYATLQFDAVKDVAEIRRYKTIDFILPGQLGFSLMSAAVFGVAFMFFNLRSTMVLKRFFATPISRPFIILGEGLSRVIFQMITAVVIILAGYYLFGFTLVNGWITFLEMLVVSFIGLMVFMGFGFAISGLAKSDSSIPPLANLITLPQFLLGGTFFSIEVFPEWLQPLSRALPLTHLNTALRKIAFEGSHLWEIKFELGVLLLWGILAYALAVKVFKWE